MSNARNRTIDALVLPSANCRTNRRIQSGRNNLWLAECPDPLVVAAADIDVLYVADFPRLCIESTVADAGGGSQLAQHPQEVASSAGLYANRDIHYHLLHVTAPTSVASWSQSSKCVVTHSFGPKKELMGQCLP